MAKTPEEYQMALDYKQQEYNQRLQQEAALAQLKQQAQMQQLLGGGGGNEFDLGDGFGSSVQPTKIPLLDAFDQYTRQEALQNPWSIAANAINKTPLPKSDNFWETLGGNALQGLLGGGLRSFGEQDILSNFQNEIAPSLSSRFPELNLGGMKDLDSGRMQLITALADEKENQAREVQKYGLLKDIIGKDPRVAAQMLDMSPDMLGQFGLDNKGAVKPKTSFNDQLSDYTSEGEIIQKAKGETAFGLADKNIEAKKALLETTYKKRREELIQKGATAIDIENLDNNAKIALANLNNSAKSDMLDRTLASKDSLADKSYQKDMDLLLERLKASGISDDKKSELATSLQDKKLEFESGKLDKTIAAKMEQLQYSVEAEASNLAKTLSQSSLSQDKKQEHEVNLLGIKNNAATATGAELFKTQKELLSLQYDYKMDILKQQGEQAGTSAERKYQIQKELAQMEIEKDIKMQEKDLEYKSASKGLTGGVNLPVDAPADIWDLIGARPLIERVQSEADKLVQLGRLTPGSVPAYIEKKTRAQNDLSKSQLKSIDSERAKIDTNDEMIATASAGLQGAKDILGPDVLSSGKRLAASNLPGFMNPYQAEQSSLQDIQSLWPKVIAASRTVGTGSVSDYEDKGYLKGGITEDKSPETIAKMIERLAVVNKYSKEKLLLIDAVVGSGGSVNEANLIWKAIDAKSPRYVMGPNGYKVPNPNRPAIEELLAASDAKMVPYLLSTYESLGATAPAQQKSIGTGKPDIRTRAAQMRAQRGSK